MQQYIADCKHGGYLRLFMKQEGFKMSKANPNITNTSQAQLLATPFCNAKAAVTRNWVVLYP